MKVVLDFINEPNPREYGTYLCLTENNEFALLDWGLRGWWLKGYGKYPEEEYGKIIAFSDCKNFKTIE